ncbi:TetR/AcrR family transcriptional regulator [Shouchella clausii]
MSSYEKIIQAAQQLASQHPVDEISYASIAKLAGVHWTTVRRHLGGKTEMLELLSRHLAGDEPGHADTRTRVLEAATRVFSKHGYAGATMDEVAVEAGQTKSVVYWHFANKSDLYLALCERNLNQQARSLPKQVEVMVQAEDRVAAISAWLYEQLVECMAAPGRPLLFAEFYTSSRDPEVKSKMRGLFEGFYAKVTDVLRQLQERGLIRKDIQAQSLAVYVQTVLNGIVLSWMLAPPGLEMKQFAQEAAELLWSGLSSG